MQWLIGIVLLLSGCEGLDRIQNGREYEVQESLPNNPINTVLLGEMKVTSYRSVKEQTDDSPFIAADGHRVHPYGVAVSRDLHQRWGGKLKFSDIIYTKEVGFKVVNDTMADWICLDRPRPIRKEDCINRHYQRNQIDVWVPSPKDDPVKYEREFHKKFKGRKLNVWLVRKLK